MSIGTEILNLIDNRFLETALNITFIVVLKK